MVEKFFDRGKKELLLATYIFFRTGKVWSRLESNFLHILFAPSCSATSKLSASTNSNAENEFLIFLGAQIEIFFFNAQFIY